MRECFLRTYFICSLFLKYSYWERNSALAWLQPLFSSRSRAMDCSKGVFSLRNRPLSTSSEVFQPTRYDQYSVHLLKMLFLTLDEWRRCNRTRQPIKIPEEHWTVWKLPQKSSREAPSEEWRIHYTVSLIGSGRMNGQPQRLIRFLPLNLHVGRIHPARRIGISMNLRKTQLCDNLAAFIGKRCDLKHCLNNSA